MSDKFTGILCKGCNTVDSIYLPYWIKVDSMDIGEPVGDGKEWCEVCNKEVDDTVEVYPRQCENKFCGKGLFKGYLIGDSHVSCSSECEIHDCMSNDNCLCYSVNRAEVDQTLLKNETQGNREFLENLLSQNKKGDELQLNASQWYRFIDTKIGSNYAEVGLDNWYFTEWYIDDCDDEVFDIDGNKYLIDTN